MMVNQIYNNSHTVAPMLYGERLALAMQHRSVQAKRHTCIFLFICKFIYKYLRALL